MKTYLKRRIDKELVAWKDDISRKPLLLRGARQVGKSSSVREFARDFEYYVEVNFEQNKDLSKLFENNLDPKEICSKLSVIYNTPIIPGKTLVFFDEIQSCIPAVSSLRFFYENYPELHIIAAGSLLEFALNSIPSFGVGRLRSLFMYPFSFDEFLIAIGENSLLNERNNADYEKPLIPLLHNKLLDYLKVFLLIGGMPEVVQEYAITKDLLRCRAIIDDLLITYQDDFSKYKSRISPLNILSAFRSIAKNAGSKINYSKTVEGLQTRQIKDIIELLVLSGIVIPVTHSSGNGVPLGAETNEKFRKFLIFDTGLYLRLSGLDISNIFLFSENELLNKGALAEIFCGLELIKYQSSFQRGELFYWQRESKSGNAEIDYLHEKDYKVIPIEVKSGTKGSMQSLNYFMNQKNSLKGFRCSLENYSQFDFIHILPLYDISRLFR